MRITFVNVYEVLNQLKSLLVGHEYQIVTTQQGQATTTVKYTAFEGDIALGVDPSDYPVWKQINGFEKGNWKWGFTVNKEEWTNKRRNPDIEFRDGKFFITVEFEDFPKMTFQLERLN